MKCDRCCYEEEERQLLDLIAFKDECAERLCLDHLAKIHTENADKVFYVMVRDYHDQQLVSVYANEYKKLGTMLHALREDAGMFRTAINKLECNCDGLQEATEIP